MVYYDKSGALITDVPCDPPLLLSFSLYQKSGPFDKTFIKRCEKFITKEPSLLKLSKKRYGYCQLRFGLFLSLISSSLSTIILFCSFGKSAVHLVQTKKCFSRGGHYHPFKSDHFLLRGKIEFKEIDIDTNIEKIRIIQAPYTISVEPNIAHLLTALDDSLFLESLHSIVIRIG